MTVGAAGLAERALAPEAGEPAHAGDAMHAAVRGLVWLASNLGERGPAVLVVDDVHWADAPSLRWLALLARSLGELRIGVVCAVRSGEPAAAPELLAELLASAPEPPVRPRALGPVGDRDAGARAAARGERRVRPRMPCRHRRQPVPARRAADPARRRRASHRTTRPPRGWGRSGPSRSRASSSASSRGCRTVPARWPAPSPSSAPALRCATPAALARLEPAEAPAPPTRCARPGCSTDGAGADARAPADRGNAVREPAGGRAGAPARGRRRAARERARRPRAHRAAPAAHRAGRRRGHRRDAARRGEAGQRARRSAERGGVPAPRGRRAAAGRRRGRRRAARAGPRARRPTCTRTPTTSTCCTRRSRVAATPVQRGAIALSGARALGLSGRFDRAFALCRQALEQAEAYPAELRERLEAELVCNGWLHASTIEEARRYVARAAAGPPALELWRVTRRRRRHAREPAGGRDPRAPAPRARAGRAGRRARLAA